MRDDLIRFLSSNQLDELAELRPTAEELGDDDIGLVREVLSAGDDRRALANLVMYPEVIPDDIRRVAVVDALETPADARVLLAAVVGVGRLGSSDLTGSQSARASRALVALLDHDDPLISQRASASLIPMLQPEDTATALGFLDAGDEIVRHNTLAALLKLLDPERVARMVEQAGADGKLQQSTVDAVSGVLDHGTADKRTLLLRRVLAPRLAALTDPKL